MVPIGAIAGLAILGAIALLSIGWALWERRRKVGNSGSGKASHGQVGQIPGVVSSSYEYKHEMEGRTAEARTAPTEIDGRGRTIIAEM